MSQGASLLDDALGVPALGIPTRARLAGPRGVLAGGLFYAALLAGTLAVWQTAALFSKPLFLPPPALVGASFLQLAGDGVLWASIAASYGRILAGWLVGSLLGVPLGLLMGRSRAVRFVLDPYLQAFRFLPAIAILPMLLLWMGSGEAPKIVLIAYAVCFVVALATMDGAQRVEPEKVRAAQCLGASPRQVFWLVVLPATVPHAITGMRIAMTGAFLAIVSAEMLAANEGLGTLIATSRLYMQTEHIFVAITLLGLLGLGTDRAIRFTVRRFGYRFQVTV